MNVKSHHTLDKLLKLYKTESNPRLARRIHGVYLASKGLSCPEIMKIIGAGRRTIQKWVQKYNNGGIKELRDKPRSGKPTKLPREMEKQFCRRIASGPSKQDGVSVLNGPPLEVGRQLLTGGQQSIGLWNENLVWFILFGEFMTYYIVWDIHVFALVRNMKKLILKHSRNLKNSPRGWMKSNQSLRTKK